VIGFLWLACIFVRCEGYLPKKRTPTTYSEIYHSAHKRLTIRLRPLSVSRHMPKAFILHFWTIACWELLCALAFFLSGYFLLRVDLYARYFAIYALGMDMILKILIVTYHHYVLTPLKAVFVKSNIMFTYFIPDLSPTSKISAHLTGIKLVQPEALYYAVPYIVFLLISFYFFTHPKMEKQFQRV